MTRAEAECLRHNYLARKPAPTFEVSLAAKVLRGLGHTDVLVVDWLREFGQR